ncbi:MAG: Mg2+ and Co2+ transporter CorB [Clostridia bacterium]|nr:Mg2+ and Co2+ transporter CorB [Clostridia bacterium]
MEDHYKHPVDEKKVRFKLNLLNTRKENNRWSLIITVISFFLSITFSFVSSQILESVELFVAFLVVLGIIVINIVFDIIGTAVTAADEAPFHAMASRKVYGAKQAIMMIRNADKVSNFCNDVIGDICGVISGTASAYIITQFFKNNPSAQDSVLGLAITGLVAAMTVGGKAWGKAFSIENSNYIIYKVAVILKFIFGRIDFENGSKKRKKVKK